MTIYSILSTRSSEDLNMFTLLASYTGYVRVIAQSRHFSFISTLNMLNCFRDYKRFIHILYHILDFVVNTIQQKKTKYTIEQPYMLSILYCQ